MIALQDVSLTLHAGEVLALMGERRRKSTLMRVLGGAHQPDQGTILVEGRAETAERPRRAGCASP